MLTDYRRIPIWCLGVLILLAAASPTNAASWEFSAADGPEAAEVGPCWMSDGKVQLFYRPGESRSSQEFVLYFNDPILKADGKDLLVKVGDQDFTAAYRVDDGEMGVYYSLPQAFFVRVPDARFVSVTASTGSRYIINTSDIAKAAMDFNDCVTAQLSKK